MIDDKSVKRLVEDGLEWEPSVEASEIGVAVDDGIVTLTGHVASYMQKLTADRVVRGLKSVRGFVDKLEVRPLLRGSDEDIAKQAANLLDWDVTVPKQAVKVEVANGNVTLTGEVPWQYQRNAAERGIRGLAGVVSVSNRIAVKPQASATEIKRRIEDALDRQADLDANRITVSVDGGKVRLDVKVRAWFERDIVERTAWGAPGVREVDDHVMIGA